MATDNLEKLNDEHHEWMQEITNWHNELVYYSRVLLRLVEGVKTGPDTEQMELFNSRFENLQERFEKASRSIQKHDKHLVDSTEGIHDKHDAMRTEIKAFKKEFATLKNDFYKFE